MDTVMSSELIEQERRAYADEVEIRRNADREFRRITGTEPSFKEKANNIGQSVLVGLLIGATIKAFRQ